MKDIFPSVVGAAVKAQQDQLALGILDYMHKRDIHAKPTYMSATNAAIRSGHEELFNRVLDDIKKSGCQSAYPLGCH
ncbi:hypothetical protein GN958_ATG14885 [Phytophthora infestans]|uniref:Uncharacterized protein n=1 Tax=Phytophthora infestans TaxID=4787 RepID=A0A8S9U9D2_PHYIN|nr:hypothetical protein GN958_ATG14885 [Phytophthora infestans]